LINIYIEVKYYHDYDYIYLGNWRSSRVSDMVYNCEGISQGCDGGVQSGDQSCREGYYGTLCGSCAEGKDKKNISDFIIFLNKYIF